MKLLVTFSKKKGREPLIAKVVKESGVLISVERAHIDSTAGEVLIDVPDSDAPLVCDLMRQKGANVRILEHGIHRDEKECVDCGACVSVCPKEVFYLDNEWRLQVHEGRCVLCGKCITACPHGALSQTL
jgi:ferredoxin